MRNKQTKLARILDGILETEKYSTDIVGLNGSLFQFASA